MVVGGQRLPRSQSLHRRARFSLSWLPRYCDAPNVFEPLGRPIELLPVSLCSSSLQQKKTQKKKAIASLLTVSRDTGSLRGVGEVRSTLTSLPTVPILRGATVRGFHTRLSFDPAHGGGPIVVSLAHRGPSKSYHFAAERLSLQAKPRASPSPNVSAARLHCSREKRETRPLTSVDCSVAPT